MTTGIRILTTGDPDWPDALGDVSPPVATLYAIGDLASLQAPVCAVVGTRRCTEYGERITVQFARALATAGVTIASGLARGIDAAAHRAALASGGRTVAVMGTGVDVPYPAGHRALHAQVGERGLLLSESPPGVRAAPGCFPRRNRIIAGLARVTVVVEAGFRSGAHSTVNAALAAGRTVAAVPGPIDSPASAGTNALIAAGAQVVTSPGDLFALLQLPPPVEERIEGRLVGDPLLVRRALAQAALPCEEVALHAGLPLRRALSAISELEAQGFVSVGFDDVVRRQVR